jgi:hypothetical protein
MRHDFNSIEDFNELMVQLRRLCTDAHLRSLPITYMEEVDGESDKIPQYLDFTRPYRCPRESKRHQSNLLFCILSKHLAS